ncbi:hypothetical protein RND71_001369 [Anisodus tanguticus]|uniref:Uncharacterized protein n=1 Tax=Anisodus tanguticus TaxID=243964 RepID=A0AAE1VS88_9SOLA|nr:hypothetical protein RND71_001369 [Anisodus tanguticus]
MKVLGKVARTFKCGCLGLLIQIVGVHGNIHTQDIVHEILAICSVVFSLRCHCYMQSSYVNLCGGNCGKCFSIISVYSKTYLLSRYAVVSGDCLICERFAGLEHVNSDKSKCQEHFDNYKECKKKEREARLERNRSRSLFS